MWAGSTKVFAKNTRFNNDADEYCCPVFKTTERMMREFTIHFPLYSGVKKFEMGLSAGSKVAAPTPWDDPRPVVVYGTSITQGGCASRPGMLHTNIMSRMLNRPFINSNIYFLDGMRLYGQDFAECTVDGAHATDLGFYRMAHTTGPIIESILSKCM